MRGAVSPGATEQATLATVGERDVTSGRSLPTCLLNNADAAPTDRARQMTLAPAQQRAVRGDSLRGELGFMRQGVDSETQDKRHTLRP